MLDLSCKDGDRCDAPLDARRFYGDLEVNLSCIPIRMIDIGDYVFTSGIVIMTGSNIYRIGRR